jgi:tetratricopeptide (TPR) repeat protein
VPGNPPRTARGKLADWERMMGGLANYVFETIQPVVLAAFLAENARTPQDIAAVSQLVQRMVETEPRIPETELAVAYHSYGEALQRQRRTDEALLAWERARAYDPKLVLPYWSAANVLFGSDPQAADDLFRQAQTLPSNTTDRLGAYLQRFFIASNKRDCATMANVLTAAELVAADRKFSTVIARMNAVHMQNCEYQQERAVNLLQNMATLHSEVATYWVNVASAQARRDHWKESHQAQLRVLAADPNKRNPFVRMNLAVTSAVLGELTQAEAYYKAGLEMHSPDSTLARAVLGAIRFYQGDYAAAEKLQRLVIADASSASADDFGDLGKSIAAQGRIDEAVGVFRQGIAHTPQFCPNYDAAATVLLKAGREAEAFAQWDSGIALIPKCDLNYIHYAQAYAERRNPSAARALLETLQKVAPYSDGATEGARLLAAIGPPK